MPGLSSRIRWRPVCRDRTGRCFLASVAAALVVAGILGANALRLVGTQRSAQAFPLPAADGCWQAICFFDLPDVNAAIAALDADPDMAAESVGLVMAGYPGGYSLIQGVYAPRGAPPLPVLVYWSEYAYHVTVEWHVHARPLLRLGDVIVALGPPQSINALSDKLVLTYADRGLRVFVIPSGAQPGRMVVLPTDPVTTLDVSNPGSVVQPINIGRAGGQPWHGFGDYRFAP